MSEHITDGLPGGDERQVKAGPLGHPAGAWRRADATPDPVARLAKVRAA